MCADTYWRNTTTTCANRHRLTTAIDTQSTSATAEAHTRACPARAAPCVLDCLYATSRFPVTQTYMNTVGRRKHSTAATALLYTYTTSAYQLQALNAALSGQPTLLKLLWYQKYMLPPLVPVAVVAANTNNLKHCHTTPLSWMPQPVHSCSPTSGRLRVPYAVGVAAAAVDAAATEAVWLQHISCNYVHTYVSAQ